MNSPSSIAMTYRWSTEIPESVNLSFEFIVIYSFPLGGWSRVECMIGFIPKYEGPEPKRIASESEKFSFTRDYVMDFPDLFALQGKLDIVSVTSMHGALLRIRGNFGWKKEKEIRDHFEGVMIEFPAVSPMP